MKFKPFQLDIKNVTEPSPLRVIALEMERDPNEKEANQVMNNLLTTVDVMIERENCEKCIHSLFSLSEKKPLYKQDIVIEKEFYDFYANNIVLQKNEIRNLCCDTVLQSQCDKWFSARSMRITVSKNVHSIKNRNKKSVETLILELLNPKKIQTPSMRYGIQKEKALQEFEIIYNVKVKKRGVLVCKNQPWLCASVDGVVFNYDCSITAIIEIKCPSSCQHQPVVNFSSKQCNVNYLHFIESKFQLKESAVIYTQCQMQMYVIANSLRHSIYVQCHRCNAKGFLVFYLKYASSFVNSLFLSKNGGITSRTCLPEASILRRICGKPLSAKTISPSSNKSINPHSAVICVSLFLPTATLDFKHIKAPGVIPTRSLAVKLFL